MFAAQKSFQRESLQAMQFTLLYRVAEAGAHLLIKECKSNKMKYITSTNKGSISCMLCCKMKQGMPVHGPKSKRRAMV